MNLKALAVFGLGATVGVAGTALAATRMPAGQPTSSLAAARDAAGTFAQVVGPPPAAAAGLPAFDDCEQLRRWYVAAALPSVTAWGLGPSYFAGVHLVEERAAMPLTDAAKGSTTDAVGTSATGTNVQEAGVDEPDRVKTDGAYLYRVSGDRLRVTDVRGERPTPAATLRLPGPWADSELLLVGDTLLVVGEDYRGYPRELVGDTIAKLPTGGSDRSWLTAVDVSDPAAPQVTSRQRLDGGVVAAREYGDGTVRIVLSTGFPPLDFVMPNRDRTREEARRLNRQVVREAAIEAWLPGVRREPGADREPLVACADVRHPRRPSGFGTLTVLTFDGERPTDLATTAVTAAGELVYSSDRRLYVATLPGSFWAAGRAVPVHRTTVHAFALDGATTSYAASGTVPGAVRDRWSFDEHDGRLRVATALGGGWQPRENAVTVLEEDGTRLRRVGSVAGLGPREAIMSVRWFDDLAVVVTFRQVDPLYTVDLRDPRRPRLLGALKIRGFSAYLHPLGEDVLLGVGQDATQRGEDLGAQVATFDLADLHAVTRLDRHAFGPDTWQAAGDEPRTFTYLPERRMAFATVESWDDGISRVVALRVGEGGTIDVAGTWPLPRWGATAARVLPLDGDRVAVVGRDVRIVPVP